MKSVIYEEAGKVTYKETATPILSDGWSLIKVSYVGICGTDLNILAGTHPRAKRNLIMGHEFSGEYVKGHPLLFEGQRVTVNPLLNCGICNSCVNGQRHVCEQLKLIGIDCDGGMAEYVKVPNHLIVPLPENMSLDVGALIEPVAVAVHAIRRGGYLAGDSIIVYGAGAIGLCLSIVLRNYGADNIFLVETNKQRLQKAEELGFETINPQTQAVTEEIKRRTNGVGADIVFDCAGHPSVIPNLLETVKIQGRIVIVAAYKTPPQVNLIQGMFKELSIQFVRVYTEKDFHIATNLVSMVSDFAKVITNKFRLEEAKAAFESLIGDSKEVKVLLEI